MGFWVGWALWQKLSLVLAGLLALVLVYSFSVLAHNRRALKKSALVEARRRAEQDPETNPMLNIEATSSSPGVPDKEFSDQSTLASKRGSALLPESPEMKKLPLGDLQQPMQTYQTVAYQATLDRQDSGATINEGRDNITFENPCPRNSTGVQMERTDRSQQIAMSESNRPSSGWFGARSSWIMNPFAGPKRLSKIEGRSRTSSELFRREMSILFDESIQTNPTETYQLSNIYYEPMDSIIERESSFVSTRH